MPTEVTPQKVQLTVKRGFERMKQYRRARVMFIKEFVGQYYKEYSGLTGNEPINLIFHTIRSIVPNLVMKEPINELITEYLPQQEYGELLGLAIDKTQRDIKLKDTLRAWVISAFFGWGILKSGLASSGETLQFGDMNVDPGQVYTELVDLDDFVFDPVCTSLEKSSFFGNRIRIPRQILLDTDGYDHDLIKTLPLSSFAKGKETEQMTKKHAAVVEMYTMQDFVDVVELWVPEADSLVTIPDPEQLMTEKYLRVTDYYGPEEGSYTFLSFTPAVPNNPFPVAPVSIWYDIHKIANRVFKKLMDQTDRQKDVLMYNPAQADEAQDVIEARDGETVATQDPTGINVVSFGGQNVKNEMMLQQLQMWYNYMSGNPDQMAGNMTAGTKGRSETATRSQILQSNANISIEDARDILYDATAEVSKKIGWYLHTDPLISLPLTKRTTGGEQIQLELTPEQRQGDFLKFTFRIIPRSMSRLDPIIKSKRMVEFTTNMLPAVANTAMMLTQLGIPFNVQRAITNLASELDLTEHVQDWFNDPEFNQRMQIMMALGPQNAGKAGGGGGSSSEGIMQNGGYPSARTIASPEQENNKFSQNTAAESQSANYGVY